MLWKNVPEAERARFRRKTGLVTAPLHQRLDGSYRAPSLGAAVAALWADVEAYEMSTEWDDPSCPIAVRVGRSRYADYRPCTGKAGADGLCARHRPDILRAPPIPNIVGESWG